jgi:triosephosphate isomerase
MRKKIVAGNWKMNLGLQEGISLFSEILNMVKDEVRGKQDVIVCSSFIHLANLTSYSKSVANVHIGAQNLSHEEKGAFTGEVSAMQIKSTGASHVIIGHSERRSIFNETNETLSKKTDKALEHSLVPIFCIGETQAERESGSFFDVLREQLNEGVFHLSDADFKKIIIAYEPVWAIGTGLTATPDQAQEVHAFIREEIANQYDQATADSMSILYGGSCNPKNAAELFAKKDIDGGLIGGASLKSRDFLDIINVFNV